MLENLEHLTNLLNNYLPFIDVATELVATVLGALAVFIYRCIHIFVRKLYLRHKYPVGGRFVTHYKESEGANTVTHACSSKLTQRLRKVRGWTKEASGKTWDLNGEIVDDKHLVGVYTATLREDQGIGCFYLELDKGDLEGFWTGYDGKTKQRNMGGEYSFKRIKKVKIKRYRSKHCGAVLDLLNSTLGEGYLSNVNQVASQKGTIAYVAIESNCVRAFSYGYLAHQGYLSELTQGKGALPTPELKVADKNGTLGVIQTVSVDDKMQGRGIGTLIFNRIERRLWYKGATAIVVPAWQIGTVINMEGILKSSGFTSWSRIALYWKEECDRNAFKCLARSNQCVCNAVFYRKIKGR